MTVWVLVRGFDVPGKVTASSQDANDGRPCVLVEFRQTPHDGGPRSRWFYSEDCVVTDPPPPTLSEKEMDAYSQDPTRRRRDQMLRDVFGTPPKDRGGGGNGPGSSTPPSWY